MRAVVIGAGPAGLLAAWGAMQEGAQVIILDAKPQYRPWTIFSLQYLHDPCGLPEKEVRKLWLEYDFIYSEADNKVFEHDELEELIANAYNRKLQRKEGDVNSTRFLWESPISVWSLKDAYKFLWDMCRRSVVQQVVTWDSIIAMAGDFDVVINTAPLDLLRPDLEWPIRHGLIQMDWSPLDPHPSDTCIYNLDPDVPWYRATKLDGGVATEFVSGSTAAAQPLRKVAAGGEIPDHPANVFFTGRWGSWDPTKLTHHAYQEAREIVRNAR